jgi:hypothetical protein
VLTRVGLAVTTPRMLDVWRLHDTVIAGADTKKQLLDLARKNAEEWAGEGATGVEVKVSGLPSEGGRTHVKSHVHFVTAGRPMQAAARWMADTDGTVFRVAASGGPWVPQEALLADAKQALTTLRRLDPPAPAASEPPPATTRAMPRKRTWWPFG